MQKIDMFEEAGKTNHLVVPRRGITWYLWLCMKPPVVRLREEAETIQTNDGHNVQAEWKGPVYGSTRVFQGNSRFRT